jgi:hypothetical protein
MKSEEELRNNPARIGGVDQAPLTSNGYRKESELLGRLRRACALWQSAAEPPMARRRYAAGLRRKVQRLSRKGVPGKPSGSAPSLGMGVMI